MSRANPPCDWTPAKRKRLAELWSARGDMGATAFDNFHCGGFGVSRSALCKVRCGMGLQPMKGNAKCKWSPVERARLAKLWHERGKQGATSFDREHCGKFGVRTGALSRARSAQGLIVKRRKRT